MAAGGPAGKTRSTRGGTATCRPAASTTLAPSAAAASGQAAAIPARQVQPIEHLDLLILGDAVERRDPGLEHLDAAGRPVLPSLARAGQAILPRRVDAADEDQPGIVRRRRRDRRLAVAQLVLADHA